MIDLTILPIVGLLLGLATGSLIGLLLSIVNDAPKSNPLNENVKIIKKYFDNKDYKFKIKLRNKNFVVAVSPEYYQRMNIDDEVSVDFYISLISKQVRVINIIE